MSLGLAAPVRETERSGSMTSERIRALTARAPLQGGRSRPPLDDGLEPPGGLQRDCDRQRSTRFQAKESGMSLSNYRVGAAIAVSDMSRARDFYEGKLGFSAAGDDPDGGRTYECAEQTTLHVFPSPTGAGASGATVAGWTVDDLEHLVDELTAKAVTFERYDEERISTNEKGIAVFGDSKSAWFKDPDGNVLALVQP
jgi:catechol 2,3-dioxygenase-like lactoylglutathione lyase family enzyme